MESFNLVFDLTDVAIFLSSLSVFFSLDECSVSALTELQAIGYCFLHPILHIDDAYLSGMNHDLKSDWKFLLGFQIPVFP